MPNVATQAGVFGYGRLPSAYVPTGIGTSSNNPAINALQVMQGGNTSNGWYWMKTSKMSNALQVYCNMEDAGGGWMCVSYAGVKQSGLATGQWYPVAWSNGAGTLSGQFATNIMDLWYHNGSNQCSNMMRVGCYGANAVPTLSNAFVAHSLTFTSNAGLLSTPIQCGVAGIGVFDPAATFMRTTWTALKGYTFLSTIFTQTASDLMYNTGTNFYWNLSLPTGQSNQLRSGSALDVGGWMRTQNKDSWGLLSSITINTNSSGTAYPGNTLAVFIK